MSASPSPPPSSSTPCRDRRLNSLSRSHALSTLILLIPLGLLHVRSQLFYTDTFQNKSIDTTTQAPKPHQVVRRHDKNEMTVIDQNLRGPATNIDDNNKDATKFNYTAFWEKATQAAYHSLKSEDDNKTPPSPCPKVYVYDLPPKLRDTTDKSSQFGGVVMLKGKQDAMFHDYLHKTHQYSFPSILELRLKSSKQCRTLDPNEAVLFFAPVLTASKSIDEYIESCKDITGEMVRDALPYLNSSNACRHFFVVGKGHVDVQHCEGWFSNPIPQLKPVGRLAYSNYSFVLDSHGAHRYDANDNTTSLYPNLASVPYPSSLHYRKSKPLSHLSPSLNKRNVLMSFVGKYNHGDVEVRERIHSLCENYKNKRVCEFIPKYKAKDMPKARATFCLEPAGDTPGRKSLSDSISFGCIPVLFSELTDDVAPWFWLDWKDRGRVLVPREDFVAGRIDLKKLLQSIPKDLLRLMQRTLQENARKFQYSLDDDQEDGIRVILDNLHREALEKERLGLCGY